MVQLHIPQAIVFLNLSPSEGTVLLAIFKLIFTENQGTLCSGCITRELVSDKNQFGLCAKFNGTSQNIPKKKKKAGRKSLRGHPSRDHYKSI